MSELESSLVQERDTKYLDENMHTPDHFVPISISSPKKSNEDSSQPRNHVVIQHIQVWFLQRLISSPREEF